MTPYNLSLFSKNTNNITVENFFFFFIENALLRTLSQSLHFEEKPHQHAIGVAILTYRHHYIMLVNRGGELCSLNYEGLHKLMGVYQLGDKSETENNHIHSFHWIIVVLNK